MKSFYFNPAEAPADVNTVVPPGDYVARVIEARFIENQNTGSTSILFRWQILEGVHRNDQLGQFVIYEHPTSDKAVDFGKKIMSRMAAAMGITNAIYSLDAFVNNPIYITTKITQREGYAAQNEITDFKKAALSKDMEINYKKTPLDQPVGNYVAMSPVSTGAAPAPLQNPKNAGGVQSFTPVHREPAPYEPPPMAGLGASDLN